MDPESIMLSDTNQRKKIPYDFTYIWNLKNNINKKTKQKHTHRHREQTESCQMRGGIGRWVKRLTYLKATK